MVSSAKGTNGRRKNVAVRPTRRQLKERALKLFEREIQFIDNSEFRQLDHAALRADALELLRRIDAPLELQTGKSIPPPLNRLCAKPLLSADDDGKLFAL